MSLSIETSLEEGGFGAEGVGRKRQDRGGSASSAYRTSSFLSRSLIGKMVGMFLGDDASVVNHGTRAPFPLAVSVNVLSASRVVESPKITASTSFLEAIDATNLCLSKSVASSLSPFLDASASRFFRRVDRDIEESSALVWDGMVPEGKEGHSSRAVSRGNLI